MDVSLLAVSLALTLRQRRAGQKPSEDYAAQSEINDGLARLVIALVLIVAGVGLLSLPGGWSQPPQGTMYATRAAWNR